MSPVSLPLVWVLRPVLEPHWTKTQHGFSDEEIQVQHVQWFSFVFMKCKLFCDVFPHWMSSICWSITQQKAFILLYLPWMWTNRTQFQS
jgi:hypothetical protein